MSRIIIAAIIDPPIDPLHPAQEKKSQTKQKEKHSETIPTLVVMPPNLLPLCSCGE